VFRWEKKWGFAVFRTAYDGRATDEAWDGLKESIMASCRKEFGWYEKYVPEEDKPEGVLAEVEARMDFVFFSDPDSLAGASVDDVRRKFRAWAVDDSQSDEHAVPLRPKGAENKLTDEEKNSYASGLASDSPRHRFFFLLDLDVSTHVRVQLVQADPQMDFDECDGGMRDVWNAKEEITEEDEDGVTRVPCSVDAIGPALYRDLMNPENFYHHYARGPPGSTIKYPC